MQLPDVLAALFFQDWGSVVPEKFTVQINGGPVFTMKDDLEIGAYNIFLDGCVLYQRGSESLLSSHDLFKGALPGGFAWELTELLSGNLSLYSLSLSLSFSLIE